MNKRVILMLLTAAALLLSGCSLARPDANTDTSGEDPMVGVLVTREPLDLFDAEAYLLDHVGSLQNGGTISRSDAEKYSDALFPVWDEAAQCYRFEGVDGYVWLCTEENDAEGSYTKLQNDDVFCDGKSSVQVTDDGEVYFFSATLYAVSEEDRRITFYMNPIFQTADGRVYAEAGSGISTSGSEGAYPSMTQTLQQELSQTANGEAQSRRFTCEIRLQLTAEPESVALFWMDADKGVLNQETYRAGTLPQTLDMQQADFLLCVEAAKDGTQTRSIYGPENENETLSTFCTRADGLLTKQKTALNWN